MTFRALLLDQADGRTIATVTELDEQRLPDADVLVDVEWSTLNYKDGLAITGRGKIVRSFPFVPGIDFAGTVRESRSPVWHKGDHVVLTGWGVGERHWGGLAEKARVRAEWLVRLPEGLSAKRAMIIGTAGFTAMLAVLELEHAGIRPDAGEIVVTGAGGGVGSIAIALLRHAGYRVVAVSGRPELTPWLTELGAAEVISREAVASPGKAPLDSARWAGAIDNVGGAMLAGILRATRPNGCVASVGLAGGADLTTTVFPFILRGVRLVGINSVEVPLPQRAAAWARLAHDLPGALLDSLATTITLDEVPAHAEALVDGRVRGRIVVAIGAGESGG